MGLDTKIMSPYRRKCNSINFDSCHFENGVPQVVHPNLVMVISTFHVQISPRNKIKYVSYIPGVEGCMRGMDYGRYMAKPVLDGGHFVYAN